MSEDDVVADLATATADHVRLETILLAVRMIADKLNLIIEMVNEIKEN